MMLPDYWLTRPNMDLDPETCAEFDRLFAELKAGNTNPLIEYPFPIPKWQFICYLTDRHGVVLHGTGEAGIQLFEPRQAIDLSEFGAQKAVYAAGDGLWAMFFAILDRANFPMVTSNACVRLVDEAGQVSEPRYVFSISKQFLPRQPWRSGVVYLLPGETFIQQPPLRFGPYEVRIPQLASLVAVKPLGYIEVTPLDFPFLGDIRGLDEDRLAEYGQAMQSGAPWPE